MTDRASADYILGTCHKAKGQEEDYVQLADDFKPLAEGIDRHNAIDEYNLVYVALTRAKRGLVLNADLAALMEAGQHRPVELKVCTGRAPAQAAFAASDTLCQQSGHDLTRLLIFAGAAAGH